jgi:hypothetical protein
MAAANDRAKETCGSEKLPHLLILDFRTVAILPVPFNLTPLRLDLLTPKRARKWRQVKDFGCSSDATDSDGLRLSYSKYKRYTPQLLPLDWNAGCHFKIRVPGADRATSEGKRWRSCLRRTK